MTTSLFFAQLLSGFQLGVLLFLMSAGLKLVLGIMEWTVSGTILLMVVLGGVGTLVGPIIGAVVWLSLEEILTSLNIGLPWGIDEFIRNHWMAVLGLFIVIVTLALKQGLYGFLVQRDKAAR